MSERSCGTCANAMRPTGRWYKLVLHDWAGLVTCIDRPDTPGQIVGMPAHKSCLHFRPRREPPLRLDPPEPPDPDSRLIPLTQGKFAIVDAADYDRLSKYKWCVIGKDRLYACRRENGKTIYMHREIMQPLPGKCVDHATGQTLNNRRSNLRNCTHTENMRNRKGNRGRTLYKGVTWQKHCHKYKATIGVNRKPQHIGYYDDPAEAARAYDYRAVERFGEYARLNFPQEWPPDRRREVHEKYQVLLAQQEIDPTQRPARRRAVTARYRGVYYDKRRSIWSAKIYQDGKSYHLGTFATELEAARAYDRAAIQHFGEFARPNLPDEAGGVTRGS